ncbi:FAD-dependent monooxygenase [Nonomuraea glycinis]|uniref:FAD-dependent oxidoreductase n=1 Tax=Nonomuraea glycinis TaxID=2047744 RepID=A0A918A6M7_9ACTN|nr:FAD-dependent monooxygenase [Nonomuraea glycinis]MCA2177569.1 FAD-dependent monooxygenase [Nonomuraea glycinis]GGP09574.1 FAD-dependent oxidoreductase [Nonomuraea glycinis]
MSHHYTEVLIVGGSLIGLSSALFLSRHGVSVILAERHAGTSIHPRTPGYNARTMELFRAAGVEEAVRAAGPWRLTGSGLLWAESLTSPNHRWLERPSSRQDLSAVSPCDDVMLSQDVLEPVLREHAEAFGADLRFGTELRAYDDGPDGVTAVLADRATGARTMVHADYLIAADGTDSKIRRKLGIGRSGVGVLEHVAGIMVRADLGSALRDRSFAICQVNNPGFAGMVRVTGDTMALHVPYDPADGVGQFTAARCVELARAAAGIPDLAVKPLEVLPWQSTAAVADWFADGRVFLAGDAAHVMPPAGAYGANTGIQDAANLAWKLAYVLNGWAEPSLLETYDTERRPVATLTVEQALATGRDWFGAELPPEVAAVELVDEVSVKFGYRYDGAGFEDAHHPTGDPGARAPHVWLRRRGRRVSTVDLWAQGAVLLAGPEGAAWTEAAARLIGPWLSSYQVADGPVIPASPLLGDPERRWATAFGVTGGGAVLIRPDGFIAWRAAEPAGPHTDAVLAEAVRALLSGQVAEHVRTSLV